jgi:hypothetical protein
MRTRSVKVRIFPIEPRSRKPIKISYSELLRSDAGTVTYKLSVEHGEIFRAADQEPECKSRSEIEQPLASIYSPSHRSKSNGTALIAPVIGYESKDEKPETDFQLVI